MIVHRTIESPVGPLFLAAEDRGLVCLSFEGESSTADSDDPASMHLTAAIAQLEEYFAGRRREFELELLPAGTGFQKAVWRALAAIPFGQTRTYSEIARAIGRPDSVRAVGAANGANRIAIIIPCHRVIGADGSLTGFGGGLDVKRWLLEHESGAPDLPFAEDFRSRRTPACTPARRAARSRLLDSSADRAKRGRSEPDGV